MGRSIRIATTQMDAKPAPLVERLGRAERLVCEAVMAGAELVALPEVFNTGYRYWDENYRAAETMEGPAVSWMRNLASRTKCHLAGSLLVREWGEIYNALVLCAPDGRFWRYDKNYPWAWERAYFRPGKGEAVAHTDLGDIGLMICWDVAHRGLWRKYAGLVDLVLAVSSPPDICTGRFLCPDGEAFGWEDLGGAARGIRDAAQLTFGRMFTEQARWLGVPAVNTGACGMFQSGLPTGAGTFLPFRPRLRRFLKLPREAQVEVRCEFAQAARVVDIQGETVVGLGQGEEETFAVGEVRLGESMAKPEGRQPRSPVPGMAYLLSDWILPLLSNPAYITEF